MKSKKRKIEKIIITTVIVIAIIMLVLVKMPHIPSKFIFSVNENYHQQVINGLDVLSNKEVNLNTEEIEKGLKDVEKRAASLFEIVKPEAVDIYISLPENRIYELYLGNNNLGIFNPIVRSIAVDGQYTAEISSTIVHEYSHHLFYQYTNSLNIKTEQIPKWLDEGLALTFEYEIMDHVLVKYGPMFTAIPFPQLEKEQGANQNTIYIQGFYAVMNLLETYGNDIIQKLMEQTAKTSFQDAWLMYIDVPYDTYNKKFEIKQNKLREIDRLEGDHSELIAAIENINNEYGEVNVYTPFISYALIEAYTITGKFEKAKQQFDIYEPFIDNPFEMIDIAKQFKLDEAYKKLLYAKADTYAKKLGYDLNQVEE